MGEEVRVWYDEHVAPKAQKRVNNPVRESGEPRRLVVSDRRCGGVDGRARSVMYISGDLLPAPRRSPKHGPVRPMRHYLLQTRVEISTLQRNHHLEARIGITQA
jgi:hypothetical protein